MKERVYGGFWRRYLAIGIDGLFIMVLSALTVRGVYEFYGVASGDLSAETRQWVETSAQAILGFIYQVGMLVRSGATLGKRAVGVKVIDRATGGEVKVGQAVGRVLASYLSLLVFTIGYLMALFDSEKRTLHDRLAGTVVIRT
jgi:uncharacterized RDD family membrane protein YckC